MENNVWLDIIKEALALSIEEKGVAVTGAKLRSKTASIARIRKLEFPPSGMGKFSSFVESYPTEFLVRRQAGQDILITPADRPELLGEFAEGGDAAKRLREDIFTGMTQIGGDEMPVYLKDTDRVIWTSVATRPSFADAIDFPGSSLEKETKLRRDFADQAVQDQEARAALHAALATTGPLKSFTAALHSARLFKEWHVFRFNAMSRELAQWAARNNLQWRDNWLSLAEPKMVAVAGAPAPTEAGIPEQVAVAGREKWLDLAARLSDEDIARISIPLDIVLRLIAKA